MFEELSPELQEKVKACESFEELEELAKVEGFELPADMLNAVAGGEWSCPDFMPYVASCYEYRKSKDGSSNCFLVKELRYSNGEFSCTIYKGPEN